MLIRPNLRLIYQEIKLKLGVRSILTSVLVQAFWVRIKFFEDQLISGIQIWSSQLGW